MSDDRICKIALNTVAYFNPVIFHRLNGAFGSAEASIGASRNDLARVDGVSPKMADQISSLDPEKIARREELFAEKAGAVIHTLGENSYPEALTSIFSPPPVISILGSITSADNLAIAVVGRRNPSPYGKIVTEKFVSGLVECGATIVSGLARGIDGIAHRMALGQNGRTLAVLGCGLNIYYPPEHRSLQKKIADGGAVISQFPFTMSPDRLTFPMRNRVISGLSLGALVIEAGEKSGALITAYAALDDNRDVFAVPGQINSPGSYGTNKLIKKGYAKLVEDVEDIFDELPGYLKEKRRKTQPALPFAGDPALTDDEKKVMGVIDTQEPKHIDSLARCCGLPTNNVSAILLALELKGKIKQFAGKLFVQR